MRPVFSRNLSGFYWFATLVLVALVILFPGAISGQEDDEEFVQEGLVPVETEVSNADPFKLFQEGQDAHEKGDLDKALDLYSQALRALPEFPEAEYQRGTIYQTRANFEAAEESFRKAVEYRQDWTLAISSLGYILIRNGKYAEAKQTLNKAIRIDVLSFPAYVAMTELFLLERPDDSEVRELYSRLVFLSAKSNVPPSIWTSKASLERLLGRIDDAKESIKRAKMIDADNFGASIETIEIALFEADYKAVIDMSAALIRRDPDNTGLKLLLARGYAMSGDRDSAVKVIESIKEPTEESKKLLSIVLATGKVDIEELEAQLAKNGDEISLLEKLCTALRIEDPEKALGYCERAYRIEPSNLSHAVGFAAALVRLRQYPRAIELLEEIKLRDADNHTVRANLATAYFNIRNFEKAKLEYLWITGRKPELAAGFYFLAITHDNLKEYVDAMANYQQFIRLADTNDFKEELDRVRLRMPILQKQIDKGQGKK